jgi:hypothetical protein
MGPVDFQIATLGPLGILKIAELLGYLSEVQVF